MTREETLAVWNAAWDACLDTEGQRAQLAPDEGFAGQPRDWCFEQWAFRHGLPPAPTILYPTTEGFIEKHWNAETKCYD